MVVGNVIPTVAPAAPAVAGVRSVAAPVTRSFKASQEPLATADNPRCSECDRFIV